MAWTRKSRLPQRSPRVAKTLSIDASSVTSQGEHDVRAHRGRQRLHPLAERLALVGEGELGAVLVRALGDAPGDGLVVRDPHDQAALAAHQSGRHGRPTSGFGVGVRERRQRFKARRRPQAEARLSGNGRGRFPHDAVAACAGDQALPANLDRDRPTA